MQRERAVAKALNRLLKLSEEQRLQARAEHLQLKAEILKLKLDRERSGAITADAAMERHLAMMASK